MQNNAFNSLTNEISFFSKLQLYKLVGSEVTNGTRPERGRERGIKVKVIYVLFTDFSYLLFLSHV